MKNPDFQNRKFRGTWNFQPSSVFQKSKRTFQKALIWKNEGGAKFLARRNPLGKGKAR